MTEAQAIVAALEDIYWVLLAISSALWVIFGAILYK